MMTVVGYLLILGAALWVIAAGVFVASFVLEVWRKSK